MWACTIYITLVVIDALTIHALSWNAGKPSWDSVKIDSCFDKGGCWNEKDRVCEFSDQSKC